MPYKKSNKKKTIGELLVQTKTTADYGPVLKRNKVKKSKKSKRK